MITTWIEAAARGRQGGPVRAGMWSAVVVGTHPIHRDTEVWLELSANDIPLGPLPGYRLEDKGVNCLWHVPIPPQGVGTRLRYRAAMRIAGGEPVYSHEQDVMVRPNLPHRKTSAEIVELWPEGLLGNRMMTVRVDAYGSTYDVYFPTVGLHADVRPEAGDQPQSRSHFRSIVGGLAIGRRLDWFAEPLTWQVFQHYQGATNLLVTELKWRHGPIRVLATDFVAMGELLPKRADGEISPGQYIKRFRVINEGTEPYRALFGVYVHAEVNGGIGEPGLSWIDGDRALLASNRGHTHANRKLARNSTVEFAVALDSRDEVLCETTGPSEALLLRWIDLPAGGTVPVDLLLTGAFTGWRGDAGTYEHWIRPALAWFRKIDLDQVEQETARTWDEDYVENCPELDFP
ncbi:MAG TPA: glycosyl hydrolase, partial [Isosphaeraceae bacterium]|nr:glycosyl hydrolase [Isosphaeraceae bacterium]